MKINDEIDFCLLIPCYNNFRGLVGSIKSVVYLENRYVILVIDDGSHDAVTAETIIREIGIEKPIVVLRSENNQGITSALNKGLAWIEENTKARYIARLDCGDISDAKRFVIQVRYLDSHPEVGLTGSWCWFLEKDTSIKYSYKTPARHKALKTAMYFRNVFIHPTVMFRTSLLKKTGYYPEDFEYAEDYAFFWKLIKNSKSFVFNQFFVICEVNRGGISFKNKNKQLKARWKVVKEFGTNPALKIAAFIRLKLLVVLPKGLLLQLKKLKG
jgi:glycosyltransferase involved in cell wall biosynthesis